MNPRSPSSPSTCRSKRARLASPEREGFGCVAIPNIHPDIHANAQLGVSPESVEEADPGGGANGVRVSNGGGGGGGGKAGGQSSSFRNVSACNRCRLRKNRCDQRLPTCASCEKAGVKCVGYDPITKREIPRSYVYYLESRVAYLESLLQDHNIPYAPDTVLDHASRPGTEPSTQTPLSEDAPQNGTPTPDGTLHKQSPKELAWNRRLEESDKLNKLVSNIGSVSAQGASDYRDLGSTSGISFARVVFAAVKSSVPGASSDKSGARPSRPPVAAKAVGSGTTSMRDSFFGLRAKPTIKQAPFPSKEVGLRLVEFYFEHANPQIPILHRGEFMKMFELTYAEGDARVRTPRELYMLNIVFAIGSGIFFGDSGEREEEEAGGEQRDGRSGLDRQCQPEEYHASAIVHLESCLSSPSSADKTDGFGGGLEELQAVLLLAGFALLRPVAPGLWYIIGVAVRLAVDLGLYYEDGKDIDVGLEDFSEIKEEPDHARTQRERQARERGRREWVRDFRRRLWWCTYSFDRLVSTCVGRPVGISDQVITTEFPSLLDDKYITPSGFLEAPPGEASYKHAAYHYFRFRLLQSEILQVLQHRQAQAARAGGANQRNPYIHTSLPSPFLSKYDSFRSWRLDIDKRLWEWKSSAPTKMQTGVGFSVDFLELNYWQCVITLYRQSLSVPPMFEGEFSTSEEVNSPRMHNVELREDEERVFMKVAEAGQRVLRLYRQLHRIHLVNYTFLATHHLFMAGISFLYAIWHSVIVRSHLTMDEVDFTILAATSVLGDLIEKCPPAEACRDAFDRMSKATVQMCMSTTGFGSSVHGLGISQKSHAQRHASDSPPDYLTSSGGSGKTYMRPSTARRPKPQFDMGLEHLLGSGIGTPGYGNSNNNGIQNVATETKGAFDFSFPPRQPQPRNQNANQNKNWNQSSTPPPATYAISPPLSATDPTTTPTPSVIDPSLLPTPSPQALPTAPETAFSAVQSAYASSPYQEIQFPFPNAPGMDPLNPGWDERLRGGGGGGVEGGTGWMEIGMGFEGGDGHDFSEGGNTGVDLFDGFFFGGAGNF
ncbi:unnamed protein product [Diplocarpon coronariae]|uniref:Transcription factor Cys n=1 Tax=Diplocarpon coronariae TaxID=2795749 RepID=A0A218Z2V0_9HELO|nr:transcription factor Cys [Marssonina coronariae]